MYLPQMAWMTCLFHNESGSGVWVGTTIYLQPSGSGQPRVRDLWHMAGVLRTALRRAEPRREDMNRDDQ